MFKFILYYYQVEGHYNAPAMDGARALCFSPNDKCLVEFLWRKERQFGARSGQSATEAANEKTTFSILFLLFCSSSHSQTNYRAGVVGRWYAGNGAKLVIKMLIST